MKVVGIHGIAHEYSGANSTGSQWLPALQDRLERAGVAPINSEDFAMVFYGDLFRPSGTKDAGIPPFDAKDVLVTLGSPLGIPNLIFDALTPKPENGVGAWPNVKQWFNIADKGDIVALEKNLAPLFGSVIDELVHNGWTSHLVTNYLTARETGQAIATGLC